MLLLSTAAYKLLKDKNVATRNTNYIYSVMRRELPH